MEWEFIIPLKKEDLINSSIEGQYAVKDVWAPVECLPKIKECRKDIKTNGCESILVHFDVLYSFLLKPADVNLFELQDLYDSIIDPLLSNLTETIQTSLHHDDPSARLQTVNIIKMVVYIYSMHLRAYEEKLAYVSENMISDDKKPRGAKGRQKVQKREEQWDWNDRKRVGLIYIFQILQEKLNSFWMSNMVEEPFVNLIGNCCYKVYENPDIGQAKLKPLRDTVAQVLGCLVSNYNHVLNFIPRALQMIKQHEHSVSAIAGAVLIMITDFNCTTLLQKLIRELHYSLSEDDSPTLAKATSVFITEIAEADAMLFVPSLKYCSQCLDLEPYSVRNAVLTVFAEIVGRCNNDDITEQLKKIRNQLVKVLLKRMLDVNSYVRSKVLQLWTKLAAAHAIPKTVLNEVLQSAKEAISDKSSLVCRNSILLFRTILKDNPFGGKFIMSQLKKTLKEEKTLLKTFESSKILTRDEAWLSFEGQLVFIVTNAVNDDSGENEPPPDTDPGSVSVSDVVVIISNLIQKGHYADAYKLLKQAEHQFPEANEIRCSADPTDKVEYYIAALKKVYMTGPCPEVCASGNSSEEYENQKAVVEFIEESIEFALLVQNACIDIQGILKSKTPTEVQEAIEFFSVAYQFGVDGAAKVVRDMLNLVWSKQQGIKEAVASAYKTLYLNSSQPTPQLVAVQVANRLIKLLMELNMEQKIALEILVAQWMKTELLTKDFINVLGVRYSKNPSEGNVNEAIAAAILLNMMAGNNPAVVSSNVPLFIEHGLNEKAHVKMVQYSCELLSKMKEVKLNGNYTRYPVDHEIFQKVIAILINRFDDLDTIGYKNMAFSAVNLIFDVAASPDIITDRLIRQLYQKVYPATELNGSINGNKGFQKDHHWEKLFDVFAEIMFRKWQFFDKFVYSSLKKSKGNDNNNQMETLDEFELENMLAADENLYTQITDYCDKMVTNSQTLEGFIRKKIIQVCSGRGEKGSSSLKISAAVALAKLMMISQTFCEENIQLYVTIMEKSVEDGIRSSLVLGFGDLLCRYPNVIEPWTNYLYNKLSESDTALRKNTVTVLCHLISQEMVKVRGTIARLCLCLEDPEPLIADQVLNILVDLSTKGNSLYNVLPDIISRLSSPDSDIKVGREKFERVVGVVLDLVVKERQSELLVEALCRRLKDTIDKEQAENLTFCICRMNYNEKSLRKLCDFLPSLTEQLLIAEVYDKLMALLNQSTKTAFKPQMKEIALEGISKIEEVLNIKDPSSSKITLDTSHDRSVLPTPRRSSKASSRKTPSTSRSTRKSRTPAKPKKPRGKMNYGSDSDDDDENIRSTFKEKLPRRKIAQPIIEESSEESD